MSKFSQGEWYVDTDGIVRCEGENDRAIAKIITSETTRITDNANACLIEEAPAMYHLLKETLDFLLVRDIDSQLRYDIDYCLLRADGSPLQCVYERESRLAHD